MMKVTKTSLLFSYKPLAQGLTVASSVTVLAMVYFLNLLLLSLAGRVLGQSSSSIQITKNATHAIPSTLYGYMWEVSY